MAVNIAFDETLKQCTLNTFQSWGNFHWWFSVFHLNYDDVIVRFLSEENEEANDMFYQFDDAVMNNTQIDDAILDYDDIPQLGDDDDVITGDVQEAVNNNVVVVKDETEEDLERRIRKVRCVFDVSHSF